MYVAIATIGYSFATIFIKLGINSGLDGLYISGTAFLLATIIFWFIVFIRKRKLHFSLLYLNICAFANIVIYYFQTKALETLSVSLFIIIYFTYPIFVLVFSSLIYKQKTSKNKLFALIFSICGLILSIGLLQECSVKISTFGVIFSLLASFANSCFFISLQKLLKDDDAITSQAYIFSITTIFLIATCTVSGHWTINLSLIQLLYILLLSIVSLLLSAAFMAKGINTVGASTASIVNIFQPIITLTAARLLFGDSMTVLQMLGGVLIFIGLIIMILDKKDYVANEI